MKTDLTTFHVKSSLMRVRGKFLLIVGDDDEKIQITLSAPKKMRTCEIDRLWEGSGFSNF
jgi:hypothetical protein